MTVIFWSRLLTCCEDTPKDPALGILHCSLCLEVLLQDGSTATPGHGGSPVSIVTRPVTYHDATIIVICIHLLKVD